MIDRRWATATQQANAAPLLLGHAPRGTTAVEEVAPRDRNYY